MTSEPYWQRLRCDPSGHLVWNCRKEPEAASVRDGCAEMAKCRLTLSRELTKKLLNEGIAHPVTSTE